MSTERKELDNNELESVAGGVLGYEGNTVYEYDPITKKQRTGTKVFTVGNKELLQQWLYDNWSGAYTEAALQAAHDADPTLCW